MAFLLSHFLLQIESLFLLPVVLNLECHMTSELRSRPENWGWVFSLREFFAMCKVGKGTLGFFAYKLDRRQGKVHSNVFHFECRKDTLKIFTVKKLVVRKLSKSRLQKGLGCFIRVVFSQLSLPDSRKILMSNLSYLNYKKKKRPEDRIRFFKRIFQNFHIL